MRTIMALFVILSIATAGLVFDLSGFDDAVSDDPSDNLQSTDELEKKGNDNELKDNFSGAASSENDGDVVGMIISGISAFFSYAGMVVLLPLELQNMGFPWFFAYPAGLFLQIMASIGLVQAASNREWR